jgi:hypothetical protein
MVVVVIDKQTSNSLGALIRYSLLMTRVEFEFEGFTQPEVDTFMERFDRAFQRAGG